MVRLEGAALAVLRIQSLVVGDDERPIRLVRVGLPQLLLREGCLVPSIPHAVFEDLATAKLFFSFSRRMQGPLWLASNLTAQDRHRIESLILILYAHTVQHAGLGAVMLIHRVQATERGGTCTCS